MSAQASGRNCEWRFSAKLYRRPKSNRKLIKPNCVNPERARCRTDKTLISEKFHNPLFAQLDNEALNSKFCPCSLSLVISQRRFFFLRLSQTHERACAQCHFSYLRIEESQSSAVHVVISSFIHKFRVFKTPTRLFPPLSEQMKRQSSNWCWFFRHRIRVNNPSGCYCAFAVVNSELSTLSTLICIHSTANIRFPFLVGRFGTPLSDFWPENRDDEDYYSTSALGAPSAPQSCKQTGSCKCWNFPIRCMRVCECVDKARQGAKCTLRSAETAAGGEARTRNVTVCSRWLQQRQRRRYSTWSSSSWHICAFDKHGKRREMNQKQSRPTPHTRFPLPKQQTSRCVGWVKEWEWGH